MYTTIPATADQLAENAWTEELTYPQYEQSAVANNVEVYSEAKYNHICKQLDAEMEELFNEYELMASCPG